MEVGRVCVRGGPGKRYLPFLGLINVKNNVALVAREARSTWFWFTRPGEGTACSKVVPADRAAPGLRTPAGTAVSSTRGAASSSSSGHGEPGRSPMTSDLLLGHFSTRETAPYSYIQ